MLFIDIPAFITMYDLAYKPFQLPFDSLRMRRANETEHKLRYYCPSIKEGLFCTAHQTVLPLLPDCREYTAMTFFICPSDQCFAILSKIPLCQTGLSLTLTSSPIVSKCFLPDKSLFKTRESSSGAKKGAVMPYALARGESNILKFAPVVSRHRSIYFCLSSE